LTIIIAYGILKITVPEIQFLNRMAVCFALCLAAMRRITIIKPLAQPVEFKLSTKIELHSSKMAMVAGVIVVITTLLLYLLFSSWGLLKQV
jgi:SSS family solute:Na+ symporter